MRNRSTWLSVGTLGVAFAVFLSPALMQTDQLGCHTIGDPRLAVLEVLVDGEPDSLIEFDPGVLSYEVTLPEGISSVTVVAEAMYEDTVVMFNLSGACPPPILSGEMAEGQTELVIEEVPEGHSMLMVSGHAAEGKAQSYGIFFTRAIECS